MDLQIKELIKHRKVVNLLKILKLVGGRDLLEPGVSSLGYAPDLPSL